MNIMLANVCNAQCTFCFADNAMSKCTTKKFMDFDDVLWLLDNLASDEKGEVAFIGGEPTLHPRFEDVMQAVVDRDMWVRIITNGIMSKSKVDAIAKATKKVPVAMMVNVSTQLGDGPLVDAREYCFKTLHHLIQPSITLHDSNITPHQFTQIFNMITKYDLLRFLRIGVSQPLVTADNDYIDPKKYPLLRYAIDNLMELCKHNRVTPVFDCAFTYCMFSNPKHVRNDLCKCNIPIDISTELEAFPCFPLHGVMSVNVRDYNSIYEVLDALKEKMEPYKEKQCRIECTECSLKSKCTLGCVGAKMLYAKK